jgi:hypothetical protein
VKHVFEASETTTHPRRNAPAASAAQGVIIGDPAPCDDAIVVRGVRFGRMSPWYRSAACKFLDGAVFAATRSMAEGPPRAAKRPVLRFTALRSRPFQRRSMLWRVIPARGVRCAYPCRAGQEVRTAPAFAKSRPRSHLTGKTSSHVGATATARGLAAGENVFSTPDAWMRWQGRSQALADPVCAGASKPRPSRRGRRLISELASARYIHGHQTACAVPDAWEGCSLMHCLRAPLDVGG